MNHGVPLSDGGVRNASPRTVPGGQRNHAGRPAAASPYRTTQDLPDEIRDDLPRQAQEIYLQAFNEAWRDYREPENPRIHTTRVEVAHKVARWAVENAYDYDEDSGQWALKLG